MIVDKDWPSVTLRRTAILLRVVGSSMLAGGRAGEPPDLILEGGYGLTEPSDLNFVGFSVFFLFVYVFSGSTFWMRFLEARVNTHAHFGAIKA